MPSEGKKLYLVDVDVRKNISSIGKILKGEERRLGPSPYTYCGGLDYFWLEGTEEDLRYYHAIELERYQK